MGEIVFVVVGDEKNRGEWKKGKVVRLVQGKDRVVRGMTLFRKGHTIERPLQLVCPLEMCRFFNVKLKKRSYWKSCQSEHPKKKAYRRSVSRSKFDFGMLRVDEFKKRHGIPLIL